MKTIENRHILILFILSSVLLVMDLFLYMNYKISFAGFYTDCVVFWLWILSFLGVIIAYWRKLMAKISLGIFVLGIVWSLIEILPFIAILLFTTGIGLKLEKKLNEKYRYQAIYRSPLGPSSGHIIENKYFLFEKDLEYNIDRAGYIEDVDFVSEDEDFIYLRTYSKEVDTISADKDLTKFQKDKQTQH